MKIIEVKKNNNNINKSTNRSMGRFSKSNTFISVKRRNRKYKKICTTSIKWGSTISDYRKWEASTDCFYGKRTELDEQGNPYPILYMRLEK